MPDETSAEEAIDFSGTERAFLCEPLAEEACRKAGVLLEDLRPRSYASFSVKGQDEWVQQKRSDAYEQRRQFKWRLVREQHARLEAEDAKRRTQQAIEASAGGAAGGASVAQRQHEAALKIGGMVSSSGEHTPPSGKLNVKSGSGNTLTDVAVVSWQPFVA